MSKRRIVVPTSEEYERGVEDRSERVERPDAAAETPPGERPAVHRLTIEVPERVARRPLRR